MKTINEIKTMILEELNKKNYYFATHDELSDQLGLLNDEVPLLKDALTLLENEFIITHNKKNEFALLKCFNLAMGSLVITKSGKAFLDMPDFSISINYNKIHSAMNQDIVLVRYETMKNRKKISGEVVRIIKRKYEFLVGTIMNSKNGLCLNPSSSKISSVILINNATLQDINKVVKTKIVKYEEDLLYVEIIKYIGNVTDPFINIEALICEANVLTDFSEETIQQAKLLNDDISLDDFKNREYYDQSIITIDGADAKDLDDAISLSKLEKNYLLRVFIADVSYYVKEESSIDQDAYLRGTSIYLPNMVIPMLPKKLSNGVCSLNPQVNRLALGVEMEIDDLGKVVNSRIFEAIIKTSHRLSYEELNNSLENNSLDKDYPDIAIDLQNMVHLSNILYNMRIKRGAFEFITTETKLLLNSLGEVEDIKNIERGTFEKVIEEFMLITNETVAETLTFLRVPFLYRVHEEPSDEKINLFLERLKFLKYDFKVKNKKGLALALQKILLDTNITTDEEKSRFYILNSSLLRTMMKAKYQANNIGHYGLASKCYTHFTSPIRRYPDLLVHRLVKQFLLNDEQVSDNPIKYFTTKVSETGDDASKLERNAEILERNVDDLLKAEFMMPFIGNEFEATISSITSFGVYVMLDNSVEGLVRYEKMPSDYYEIFVEQGFVLGKRSNISYQLGDRVIVKLINISVSKRQLDFKLKKRK